MRLESPAVARNRTAILDVLREICPSNATVLEVASGSGEHAVYLSPRLPVDSWQPTDCAEDALLSINAWKQLMDEAPAVQEAKYLDVGERQSWAGIGQFDLIVCMNMIHISPPESTDGLFKLASTHLNPKGTLYLYGPFIEDGVETAPSNINFDLSLKARNPSWGLRSLQKVDEIAAGYGLERHKRWSMPANNISVIYRRS